MLLGGDHAAIEQWRSTTSGSDRVSSVPISSNVTLSPTRRRGLKSRSRTVSSRDCEAEEPFGVETGDTMSQLKDRPAVILPVVADQIKAEDALPPERR